MRPLNVAHTLLRSRANGPGERFVLWVQGCGLACDGCWNPDTWSFGPRSLVTADALVAELRQVRGIEGITISGGEPFAQAEGLYPFVAAARELGLSVLVFTGHEVTELKSLPARRLLELIDVLVAGRYVRAEAVHGLPLLGSANQRVHFLTQRYNARDLEHVAISEAHVSADGSVLWTGFPGGLLSLDGEPIG